MNESPLIQHYQEKQEAFHLCFKRALEKHSIEDIHQLRLSLKRLKALWSLMEFISPGSVNKKEYSLLILKLFKEAGDVRDTQVSLAVIGKSRALYLKPFTEHLREAQSTANEKLLATMRVFDFKRLEKLNNKLLQEMNGLSAEIVLQQSATYVLKKIRKVRELKDRFPHNRKLHKIRIHLKVVIEILKIMSKLNAATRLGELTSNLRSIDKRIGKWHDNIILLTSLNDFTSQNTRKNNGHLNNLIDRIHRQQETKQQYILELMNQYITSGQLKKN